MVPTWALKHQTISPQCHMAFNLKPPMSIVKNTQILWAVSVSNIFFAIQKINCIRLKFVSVYACLLLLIQLDLRIRITAFLHWCDVMMEETFLVLSSTTGSRRPLTIILYHVRRPNLCFIYFQWYSMTGCANLLYWILKVSQHGARMLLAKQVTFSMTYILLNKRLLALKPNLNHI